MPSIFQALFVRVLFCTACTPIVSCQNVLCWTWEREMKEKKTQQQQHCARERKWEEEKTITKIE